MIIQLQFLLEIKAASSSTKKTSMCTGVLSESYSVEGHEHKLRMMSRSVLDFNTKEPNSATHNFFIAVIAKRFVIYWRRKKKVLRKHSTCSTKSKPAVLSSTNTRSLSNILTALLCFILLLSNRVAWWSQQEIEKSEKIDQKRSTSDFNRTELHHNNRKKEPYEPR